MQHGTGPAAVWRPRPACQAGDLGALKLQARCWLFSALHAGPHRSPQPDASSAAFRSQALARAPFAAVSVGAGGREKGQIQEQRGAKAAEAGKDGNILVEIKQKYQQVRRQWLLLLLGVQGHPAACGWGACDLAPWSSSNCTSVGGRCGRAQVYDRIYYGDVLPAVGAYQISYAR